MTATDTSTAVTVVYPPTGEVLNVREAPADRLAEFVDQVNDLRSMLAEDVAVVGRELIRRMDMDRKWTFRVGDPTSVQWEISTASPDAGTDSYPPVDLERTLQELIAGQVISETAAASALSRTVTIEVAVPFAADAPLEKIAEAIEGAVSIEIAGTTVQVKKATVSRKVIANGIKALRKGQDCVDALDAIKEKLPTPTRTAKVKRKGQQ